MGWIQTGLEYQAFHTLAIFKLAVAMQRRISIWFYWSSVFLALGTVLFSMMDFALNEEQLELQEMVREFVEKEITPMLLKWMQKTICVTA